jgi:hypothetical protein
MNRVGKGLDYLRQTFLCIKETKIKEGIFVSPQIKLLFKTPTSKINWMLPRKESGTRLKAYAETFWEIKIRKLSRNHVMSYFLHTVSWCATCSWSSVCYKPTWAFSPGNTIVLSEERSESFHQDISQMEKRYSGKWNPYMLADYCWTLVRETPTEEYKRQRRQSVSSFTFIYFYVRYCT